MRLTRLPVHPLLLAIYPIAHLYARNIVYVPFDHILRSCAISLGLTLIFLLGVRIISRSWDKAGAICSLAVVLFFSFGHVANALGVGAARHTGPPTLAVLRGLWLAVFLIAPYFLLRSRINFKTTQLLNAVAVVLVIFPLTTIASTLIGNRRDLTPEREALAQLRGERHAEGSLRPAAESPLPDIYYIIFDGYERADLLQELYGYDNSPFLEALQERGFYVASASRSNYLSTNYSLNTSLNLVYFQDFPTALLRSARFNLQTNYVSEFLREQGYQVVVFDSGSADTNNQAADFFLTPSPPASVDEGQVNPFEQLLLRTTLGAMIFEAPAGDGPAQPNAMVVATVNQELDLRRERIRFAFSHLPDFAARPGPYFLFAHIYLPHVPFLFGPGGEELHYHENLNLFWYEVAPEDYLQTYTDQVDYLNQAALQTIDVILATSVRPVVIVLQGDHGDDWFLDWDAPTAEGVNARSAILNAIYFSDQGYSDLYPTLTPVNTFRLILNHWFGTRYPLLPDRVFTHEHPLSTPLQGEPEFEDACPRFGICPPDPPSRPTSEVPRSSEVGSET
jgi:hypothetical protein